MLDGVNGPPTGPIEDNPSVGVTERDGCAGAACATVTSFGLPVASVAVTRIVPVRDAVPAFAEAATVIVPLFDPFEPDEIDSQALPDMTVAVQAIVPVPVLETEKAVVPAVYSTSRVLGVTLRMGCAETARLTGRVVFPVPLVVFVNVTVSL